MKKKNESDKMQDKSENINYKKEKKLDFSHFSIIIKFIPFHFPMFCLS